MLIQSTVNESNSQLSRQKMIMRRKRAELRKQQALRWPQEGEYMSGVRRCKSCCTLKQTHFPMERNIYVGTPKYNEGQRVFLLKVTLPLVRKDGDELVVCGTSTDFLIFGVLVYRAKRLFKNSLILKNNDCEQ